MNDLFFQLRNICKRCKEGSYATQRERERILELCTKQLREMGYRHMKADSLRQKHGRALVNCWLSERLKPSTIKNRTSHLRWWAEKIGKPNVILSNDEYGIPRRQYLSDVSKARELEEDKLKRITDDYVVASLRLQAAFGLRRKEAIMFIPHYADQGDYIQLKGSWTKGRKARTIPIRYPEQRAALDHAKSIAGKGSLIPKELKFHQQKNCYEKATAKVGLKKMHGLRHRYAQQRYQELTGWPCPHEGGPKYAELSHEQKAIDKAVRLTLSKELGHERLSVIVTYCGK